MMQTKENFMSQTLKFLVGREYNGQVNSNKSCYFIKKGTMILLNCGKGVVDAMRRTHALNGVKDVYIVITLSNKEHLYDLKKFLEVLKRAGIKPKILESISLDKNLLKKMKLTEDEDYQLLEPLQNNVKWINFLAVPHTNKKLSCPVELYLDDKKIFYGGDCGIIPFSIQNYDEYYFDFGDKEDEYHLDVNDVKSLVKKNKIKKKQLWLVHLQNLQALQAAQKIGMQVAEEEQKKFTKPVKKQAPANAPKPAQKTIQKQTKENSK